MNGPRIAVIPLFIGLIPTVALMQSSQVSGSGESTYECGAPVRWRMPATLVIERTREEIRMYDVLVTQARIDAIILAAEAYCRANHNAYPSSTERLISPPPAILPQMAKCRLAKEDLNDSWDRPIFYAIIDGHLVVRSAGPDGRFSTIDDIGLPEAADARIAETFDIGHECRGS